MEILTPCRSETPENINNKIGQNDYVMDPFNPANFRKNRSKVVRSPYLLSVHRYINGWTIYQLEKDAHGKYCPVRSIGLRA